MLQTAQNLVERELTSSERLVWSGAPRQGLRFRPADVMMIPFSLAWGGFAFFWEYSVVTSAPSGDSSPIFMMLWGIPFVLIGAYIIVGRFFVDAWQRARTTYAVTDQRVLIVTTWWNRQVKSLSLKTLGEVSLTERRDGSGSITFGSEPPLSWMASGGWPGGRRGRAPAFELLDRVRNVYDLIQGSRS